MKTRALLAIVLTSLFAACGGGEKKGGAAAGGDKNTLVIAFDGSPSGLDPRVCNDTYCGRVWDMTASGLIKLLSDSALRSRLGHRARLDAIANYSIPRYLSEINSLYRHIITHGRTPHARNVRGFEVKLSAD